MFTDDANALKIAHTLRTHGHKAYFVGGCVRDFLLGADPKDIDIATDATPDRIQSLFPFTIAAGKQFGVIIVIMGKQPYEVATFRKDLAYSDGRHPEGVVFTSEREDVERRDFTINGLLYDPFEKKIIDFIGGENDLQKKIIRTIGDPEKRFTEDKLRMLRGVRFAARLGFTIEEKTFTAMKKMAPLIHQCSAERIREELSNILTHAHPDRGIRLLDESALLHEILHEAEAMKNVEQPPEFHPEGDVYMHTLLMLSKMKENPGKELAWAVLLHDIGKPATFKVEDRIRFNEHEKAGVEIAQGILGRFKFSNDEKERILELVGNHMRFMNVTKMRVSTLKKFLRMPYFEDHLELHYLDCIGSHGGLDHYEFCKEKLEEFSKETEQLRPRPLINGNMLIGLGLVPGPLFKEILGTVEDMQLEGKLVSEEEAVDYVKKLISEKQLKQNS